MQQLEPGQHLISDRGLYQHHGIVTGPDEIVHYAGWADGPFSGPVEKTTLAAFSQGQPVSVRSYRQPRYTGDAVVARVMSRLGENKYDLHANNCEHLCSWAVTGRKRSKQSDIVDTVLGIILPGVGWGMSVKKHIRQIGLPADDGNDLVERAMNAAASALPVVSSVTGSLPLLMAPSLLLKAYKRLR